MAQHQRDFAAVRAVRRDNRLRQALAELVAGASAYGVLDATVLSTPKAALCGALAALGVHGLAGIQRKHRLGGPRFRAVRIVTELLEARERQPNVIAPKGAHIDAIGSLRGDALAMGDAAFFDALGTAEDCLRYLQLRPDDQRARAAADEALESLLRVARKGGRAWRDESIDD